ncbi:MAG: NDP-sugar synthase [Clostridia bacterium]|nr:NDP-sugar synthase [Clostridia bacterium]
MLAVIIDKKRTGNWSERGTLLNLSVFSENLYTLLLKSIMRISPERIIVFSQNDIKNVLSDKVDLIDNEDDLIALFSSEAEGMSAIFSSSFYIDINEKFIFDFITEKKEINVVSDEFEIICSVLKNRKAAKILSENYGCSRKLLDNNAEKLIYNGYSKKLDTPLNYKDFLTDILYGKTSVKLPEIAQGVYAEDKIPEGNFTIIPPVYFDEQVQVENGAVIGPASILAKETLVSKKSNIKNSVLLNGVYISSDVFVDDALLCENVSVRKESVVMGGSVIGYNSTIGEETVIENNSYILPYTKVDERKHQYINFKKETNESPAGFYGYTPEKSALLGAAVGKVFNCPLVAVASDGELNSTALKLGLLGGLITTGATCYDFGNTFLSSLHYFMSFCELECAVFVSGNRFGTVITVFTNRSYSLTSSQYYNIKTLMLSGKIDRCSFGDCKNIRQIHGMSRMYIQNLIKDFNSPFDSMPIFKCENKRILSVAEIASSKVGISSGKNPIVFNLNSDGTKVSAEYAGVMYSDGKLREIVDYYGNDSFAPKLWDFDAVILCFELLHILKIKNISLKQAAKSLPRFYIAEGALKYNESVSSLINRIGGKGRIKYKSGDIYIEDGDNIAVINKSNDDLRIIAKALSSETAEEIVGDILKSISET